MASKRVVFPAPLGPPIPSTSPGMSVKLILLTAVSAPNCLVTSRQANNGSVTAVSKPLSSPKGTRSALDPRRQLEGRRAIGRRRNQAATLGLILNLQELMWHAKG